MGLDARAREPDDGTRAKLPPMNDVQPFLAVSWQIARKGIVFALRPDARAPSGHTLTPADVIWSLRRVCAVDVDGAFYLRLIGVNCKNPATATGRDSVRINQTHASRYTVGVFSSANLTIWDSRTVNGHTTKKDPWGSAWLADHTAGYGPYSVSQFTPAKRLVLSVNPHYWDAHSVYYTTVLERQTPNPYVELQLLENGSASRAAGLDYPDFAVAHESSKIFTELLPTGSTERLAFFQGWAPWTNPLVRRAISEGIDRDGLVREIFLGDASPGCSPVPDTFMLPFSAPCATGYDARQARALLARAGYGPSNPLRFTLSATAADTGPYISDELTLISQQLATIGVQVTINLVANSGTYDASEYPPSRRYSTTLDVAGSSFADAGLSEELALNSDLLGAYTFVTGVLQYSNKTALATVREMLGSTSDASYKADEQRVAALLAGSYVMPTVVAIPELIASAQGIVGYASYASPQTYYDLLHPAA